MSQESMLVTAYQQVGEAYKTAIGVSMFTWREFAVRNVMLITAVGFLLHERKVLLESRPKTAVCLSVGLLGVGALLSCFTAYQMRVNQKVIQNVLGSGLILECRAKGSLGHRYFNAVRKESDREYFKCVYGNEGPVSLTKEDAAKLCDEAKKGSKPLSEDDAAKIRGKAKDGLVSLSDEDFAKICGKANEGLVSLTEEDAAKIGRTAIGEILCYVYSVILAVVAVVVAMYFKT